jgi:hypothetical protein
MSLLDHIPLEQAQRFYDHVAQTPGEPAEGIRITHLRGTAGRATDNWSRVFHWRVPGSATRLDYVYRDDYVGEEGDPHPVVRIKAINFSSHVTRAGGRTRWPRGPMTTIPHADRVAQVRSPGGARRTNRGQPSGSW